MSNQLPQDQYVKVGNINTRYWSAGDKGSVVVLIHGLGGFIENWVYNIGPLSKSHRVYALDLPGFGRSDKPLIRDLTVLVRFLAGFLDALGIEKASLIGNSLGGGLVLFFALGSPGRVEKLVLVDTAGMGKSVIADFKVCSLPVAGELLIRPTLKSTANLWQKVVYDPSLVTPELVDSSFKLASLPGARQALLATLRAGIGIFGQRDKYTKLILKDLGKITEPTLIFWGSEDRIIPVAHSRIAAAKITGARLHIWEKCGHMPMFEYPDKFNTLVLDFLSGR